MVTRGDATGGGVPEEDQSCPTRVDGIERSPTLPPAGTPRPVSSIPSALERWDTISARLAAAPPVVFLDFDGTLSPLVDEPSDAQLAPGMADALDRLGAACAVAIVSGRGADDVGARVGRTDVWIAGSHGFEIVSPDGSRHLHPDAGPADAALDEAAAALEVELDRIAGVRIERKRLGLTVHDRMVSDDDVTRVRDVALAEAGRHPELRVTRGKRVTELRPDIEWDKGAAVGWLLERLADDEVVPIYIGDDATDEDAFAAIAPGGVSIVVAEGDDDPDRPSIARWSVADPAEVRTLVARIADVAVSSNPRNPATEERPTHGS